MFNHVDQHEYFLSFPCVNYYSVDTESIGILPPPPGGVAKIAPPPGSTQTTTTRQQTPSQPSAQQPTSQPTTTDWGDFAAFSNNE